MIPGRRATRSRKSLQLHWASSVCRLQQGNSPKACRRQARYWSGSRCHFSSKNVDSPRTVSFVVVGFLLKKVTFDVFVDFSQQQQTLQNVENFLHVAEHLGNLRRFRRDTVVRVVIFAKKRGFSMEMLCFDDIGRDSWVWVGPPTWRRACYNSPEWGGGCSPVKTEPPQIVLLLLLLLSLSLSLSLSLLLLFGTRYRCAYDHSILGMHTATC